MADQNVKTEQPQQITISLRIDAELKKQFEEFCEDVGMTMTTAITIFAKKTVRENRIPFEITGSRKNS